MDDSTMSNDNPAIELTGRITVAAVIVLFLVVVFVISLHLYAKWFWWQTEEANSDGYGGHSRRHRRRFVFTPGQDPTISTIEGRGLDPAILKSIPVVLYNPAEFKDGLECAVCLSELEQGEKARMLPKCNHGFHVDCIGMWFQSHSTCPLCRNPVAAESSISSVTAGSDDNVAQNIQMASENLVSETQIFPTNVLFWGNQTQVSSVGAALEEGSSSLPTSSSLSASTSLSVSNSARPHGTLVIDIPSEMVNPSSSSPSTAARFADDELKSPMITRLRSLKRLLSREKRSTPCSPSSVGVDLEQVGRGQSQS